MSRRRFLVGAAILVVSLATSACGGGGESTDMSASTKPVRGSWSRAVCDQVAQGVARQGEQVLLHYRPPLSNYPPDVAVQGVDIAVWGIERRNHCPPAVAGEALSRRLTPRQRAELLSHLPPRVVRYLRRGLSQA